MTNQTIKELLLSTGREGMDKLVEHMEEAGFFKAPCSGAYHLCKEGGLAEHSLNVYHTMLNMTSGLDADVNMDSVIICSLLHDLGKMGDHNKPNYTVNLVRSKSKNKETGEYDYIQSEAKPYETNKDLLYIDHEIRSIKIASKYIDLTEDEEFAILYHNGLYGALKYQIQNKETELYMLLHFSDLWASRVLEV